MKRSLVTLIVILASTFLSVGIVMAATRNITGTLGGATGDTFQLSGTIAVNSLKVGAQGTGGVTYFNGSIVNNTTTSGADNPVTFGDNVRIDGRIYRGATPGTSDSLPLLINDNLEVAGSLTIASLASSGVITSANIADSAITSAKITDGTIATADLADGAVTSAKIIDGAIAAADLADSSVTSVKINDGTVATGDLADDSVTPAKINGTGGANLPIAYGYCHSNGTTHGGTSNVSCSWNAGLGRYEITISGENYFYTDYVTTVTPISSYIPSVGSISGMITIDFIDDDGATGKQTDFGFVTYKL